MTKSIANQAWEKVSINEVVYAFLAGEYEKCVNSLGQLAHIHKKLFTNPNLDDESQNHMRSMLLCYRIGIMSMIPLSTKWYKVSAINESHYNELFAINDKDWNSPNDNNELIKVAKRMNFNLDKDPSEWELPILWGKSMNGPFTIIEGNHRFSAIALTDKKLNIPCYIGVSDDPCPWFSGVGQGKK